MKIYRDEAFWKEYYEKNRQYVGDNRKIWKWMTLKDRRLYRDNGYAMEQLAAGAYDRLTPEQFRKKWSRRISVSAPEGKTVFHSYWCGEIGERQIFSMKSLLATQPAGRTELWLWLDRENGYEGYEKNEALRPLLPLIRVLPFDADQEIRETPYEDFGWMFHGPELTFRADGLRRLELYRRGGVYFDLDVMFLKELTPVLAAGEFCYAWEGQPYANNALLYLKKGSAVNEAVTRRALELETFRPWQVLAYGRGALSSYIVYPSAFFDPLWMKRKEEKGWVDTFGEFFTRPVLADREVPWRLEDQQFFPGVYAHHWHNQWKTQAHPDSLYSWFDRQFDRRLKEIYGERIGK